MASEKEIVAAFEKIQADVPGFIAASMVDLDSGMTLAVKSARPDFDLAAASAFNSELVKQKFKTIKTLGLKSTLEDMLLTLSDQLHLIKLVGDRCAFIIVSAHTEHAVDGFELDVADYLLKPVKYERFLTAIDKVRARHVPTPAPPVSDHFFLKCGHELVRFDHAEVLFISAMRDYVAVHTRHRGRFLSLEHLRDLEARLPAEHYCRIHRSHIVRIGAVQKALRDAVIVEGSSLPVSDSYAQRLRAMLRG